MVRIIVQRHVLSLIRPHLPTIGLTQLPCLLLAALLLDGGRGLRVCMVAVAAHWLAIVFVVQRDHPPVLTGLDQFVLSWGFFPCLLFAAMIGSVMW